MPFDLGKPNIKDEILGLIKDQYDSFDVHPDNENTAISLVTEIIEYSRIQVKTRNINEQWNSEKLKSFGYGLNFMIVSCTYNDKICDLDKDFTWSYDFKHGNCFIFNKNK